MRVYATLLCFSAALVVKSANGQEGVGSDCRIATGHAGSCINVDNTRCTGGSTHRGFCPGPSNVRCCVVDDPVDVTTCTIASGERGLCQNINEVTCTNGLFHRGFCPGPSEIRCCVKFTNTPPPTSIPTRTRPPTSSAILYRKEVRDLTQSEIQDLVTGINELRRDGTWSQMTLVHRDFFNRGIHNGPEFFPWHRVYLRVLEEELERVLGKPIAIPYWDWSLDARNPGQSRVFQEDFFGGFGQTSEDSWFAEGCIQGGPFSAWEPCLRRSASFRGTAWDRVDIQMAFNRGGSNYDSVRFEIENLHNSIHSNIGGDMASGSSPNDPVFYLHHAFIDKLWSDWQGLSPENRRAYAEGLSSNVITHYSQYRVSDTFDMRPYEDASGRRLLTRFSNMLHEEGVTGTKTRYLESSSGHYSMAQLAQVAPARLAKVPRTCTPPSKIKSYKMFWNDNMEVLFEASSARVAQEAAPTPSPTSEDCLDTDTLDVLLEQVTVSGGDAAMTTPAILGIIGALVVLSAVAVIAVVIRRRRSSSEEQQETTLAATQELPEL